ncbi:transcription factor BIM2 isoform X2 [Jatropha curcas]|uniref:transcription factor BIM2 isoform X2 n=1 Tax=Jatropha curcas TaxID=180498 RepID=UPI0009D75B97|nr:transcription factor BIM2 isoform X2 [Jatropha curcas]XP_020537518.1 transcription factor BIM2 isoform X2 [Jatropha curcas]
MSMRRRNLVPEKMDLLRLLLITTTTIILTVTKICIWRPDGKNSDKANAMRSKHSVTEQRRRSKINERFQILRDLIPHSDQKRDTASFLLEVIEYVQYLQEKVQKYEGSYQGWTSEPTKLMPWRNSHWRVQSFMGHPQTVKNGSGPGLTFPGKFDENNIAISPSMLTSTQNLVEPDTSRDIASKGMERQPELANKVMPLPMSLQTTMPTPVQSDGVVANPLQQSVSGVHLADFPVSGDAPNQQEKVPIEGGTISISSVYSQGLFNSLTQALHSAGVDLSQANISVQIDLGKRANRGLTSGTSTAKDPRSSNQAAMRLRDMSSGEHFDQAQKRLKT